MILKLRRNCQKKKFHRLRLHLIGFSTSYQQLSVQCSLDLSSTTSLQNGAIDGSQILSYIHKIQRPGTHIIPRTLRKPEISNTFHDGNLLTRRKAAMTMIPPVPCRLPQDIDTECGEKKRRPGHCPERLWIRPIGFEPITYCLEGSCSIQVS